MWRLAHIFVHLAQCNNNAEEKSGEKAEDKKLIQKEHQNLGSVGFGIYKHYFKAAGGTFVLILTLFCFLADTACRSFADW